MNNRVIVFVNTWLQPGVESKQSVSRFNGLSARRKTLKRFLCFYVEAPG